MPNSTSEHENVVIVGGGVSGLAAAFYLGQRKIRSTILEASPRVGGLIRTDAIQGCLLEAGPDSFIANKPAVRQLARDLGIESAIIGSNDAERRIYIVKNGQLVSMPKGMIMMVPTDLDAAEGSPLFGEHSKRRFREEESQEPRKRSGDFSIQELVEDHFGSEALEYITEPLLSGVYGGDPVRLSARSVLPRFVEYEETYGSLIKGAQKEARSAASGSLFLSFQSGMEQLIATLDQAVRKTATVRKDRCAGIESQGQGSYSVRCASGETLTASHVILALPAHTSSALVAGLDAKLSDQLAAIPYSSAILGVFLFERGTVERALNGFGFLVPRPERQTIAAGTWINTKFPSRVAPSTVAIRVFVVDPEAPALMDVDDETLCARMLADLERLMGSLGKPTHTAIHRWPQSMPQYVVGHQERITQIEDLVSKWPGLHLSSNYIDGVGIPDSIRRARGIAEAM